MYSHDCFKCQATYRYKETGTGIHDVGKHRCSDEQFFGRHSARHTHHSSAQIFCLNSWEIRRNNTCYYHALQGSVIWSFLQWLQHPLTSDKFPWFHWKFYCHTIHQLWDPHLSCQLHQTPHIYSEQIQLLDIPQKVSFVFFLIAFFPCILSVLIPWRFVCSCFISGLNVCISEAFVLSNASTSLVSVYIYEQPLYILQFML